MMRLRSLVLALLFASGFALAEGPISTSLRVDGLVDRAAMFVPDHGM